MNALYPRPAILDITPYKPGESRIPGFVEPIKLASNESPLGPSPKVRDAIAAQMDRLHLYPDGDATALRQAIAARHDIKPDNIVCTAGSEQMLHLLVRAYAGPGDEVLYPRYGFLVYALAAKSAGATPVEAPQAVDHTDIDVILNHVTARTRIVFLANPNNPTGTYLPAVDIRRLRENLPREVLMVVDEAYAEYVDRPDYESAMPLVENSDNNVVVTRTFSKAYGLAALRVGWTYCPPPVVDVIRRIRYSFAVTTLGQVSAIAALGDRDHLARAKAHNDAWLPWLTAELEALDIKVTPSVANFALAHFRGGAEEAKAADAHLRRDGIIVRPVAGYGLPQCLRITVGREHENRKLIDSLKQFRGL
ncbi:MAG: histidinol-phosphate transaminase [Alphaproteobacteria bacterium]|nr:MAG: histidinol-phosphate transaminase [Alphaproteobacteria bacterium]